MFESRISKLIEGRPRLQVPLRREALHGRETQKESMEVARSCGRKGEQVCWGDTAQHTQTLKEVQRNGL